MMRRFLFPLALLGLCGPATAAPDVSPAASKAFQGWTGTCNNIGACVAIGTMEADTFFYVRIARDAGAAAAPQVKLVLVVQEALKGTFPAFGLNAREGGKTISLGSFPAMTDAGDMSQFTAVLAPPERSLAFIESIRNADTLDYDVLGTKGTFDLKGLSATLRWIDAQQGRVGTPTALVAKGMTPIGQVPEPRKPATITAAPVGSVTVIDKPVPSHAVLAKAAALEDCDKDTVDAHQDAEAWHLGPDLLLVSTPCINGAYNFSTALYFTDAAGGTPRPVRLPQPAVTDAGSPNIVTNMNFDPTTMILSEFGKGRGLGDCGETKSWIWTGTSFELVDATRLDACAGAVSDDWPNIYSVPHN